MVFELFQILLNKLTVQKQYIKFCAHYLNKYTAIDSQGKLKVKATNYCSWKELSSEESSELLENELH